MPESYLNKRKFPVLQAIVAATLTIVALAFLTFGDFRKTDRHVQNQVVTPADEAHNLHPVRQ